ncbi:MAG: hypothetical protein ABSA85_09675 [Terracidiphilus sp.]|jgi:hypothetical protein
MRRHSVASIIGIAVLSMGLAAALHEGLGHGVTAWVRGDGVTELTSNHLSSMTADRLVEAGGTIVNLIVAALCLWGYRLAGERANLRYFFWLFGAVNLLDGAGYFLYSGAIGVGDWAAVIRGLPHEVLLRIAMSVFGLAFYIVSVRIIGRGLRAFMASDKEYDTVSRLPYFAACIFYCIAGAFDPLGIKLLFISTIPAAFGGLSGLLWGDKYMPRTAPERPLAVTPSRALWVTAAIFGVAFVAILGRGIEFRR